MKKNYYQVIIIGAGPAGIGAAKTFEKANLQYLIFQARNRIGGRLFTNDIEGIPVDLGACWIHAYGQGNPFKQYIEQFGIKEGVSYGDNEKKVYLDGNDGKQYEHQIIRKAKNISNQYFKFSELQAQNFEQDISVQRSGKNYFQSKIEPLGGKEKRSTLFQINMTERHEGSSISQLSAKNYYFKVDDGINFSPQGGYGTFLSAIAKDIKIQLSKQVLQIHYNSEQVKIICKDESVYFAKKLISSIPLGVLKLERIKFQPQLPKVYKESIQRLGVSLMNKVIVSFQQNFWGNAKSISIVNEQRNKFSHLYNYSEEGKNILCCLIAEDFARKCQDQPESETIKEFLSVLKKTFRVEEVKIKSYIITNWGKDYYSLGSYTSFHVGSSPKDCYQLRKPIEQTIWFVGEHCYAEYIGTAHGAFKTGVWAATQVIKCLKDK